MDLLQYIILGLALPTLAGTALARALLPSNQGCRYLDWLGFGWLLGVGMTSASMHLVQTDLTSAAMASAAVLAVVTMAASFAGRAQTQATTQSVHPPYSRLLWVAVALLGGLVALQFILAATEILIRPTYPWDAWSSWAYKAKAWFLVGHYPTFVPPQEWPRAAAGDIFTILGAHYPTLIAGYQVYLAAWLDEWHEPLVNLPWLFCYLALLLMFTGEVWRASRHWGLALLAGLGLASIPMLVTHTALAGYMDLWLATGLLGLTIALARAWQSGGVRGWGLVLLLAAVCIGTKVEGVVWVGLIAATAVVRLAVQRTAFGRRAGWAAAGGVAVLFAGLLLVEGWGKDAFAITLPYIGSFSLTVNEAFRSTLKGLFLSWNWHLFYWLMAGAAIVTAFRRGESLSLQGRLFCDITIASTLALALLFLFTSVHGATTDITNYNRILLQWVPVQGMCLFGLVANRSQGRP